MPGGYEINEYQLPLDFTEEERERFNNVGFSDEFKRQILTQKEGGWGMVGTWKVTNRTKDGVAYTKIPVNESNMVDVGECYTGRIIDRLAAYEDSGLSPEDILGLKDYGIRYTELEKRYREALKEADDLEQKLDQYNELTKAKADGRLIALPCKVGTVVYAHSSVAGHDSIISGIVQYFVVYEQFIDLFVFFKPNPNEDKYDFAEYIRADKIGKTVFLTREEAEKAIGGAENGK